MRINFRVWREGLAHFAHGENMAITTTGAEEKRREREAGTYDVPELAALLKCSERHIRNMADAGSIPGILRFGRLVRFHREIVNNWLIEQARGANRG